MDDNQTSSLQHSLAVKKRAYLPAKLPDILTEPFSTPSNTLSLNDSHSISPIVLQHFDREALSRYLTAENLGAVCLSPQGTAAVDISFLGVRLSHTAEGIVLDTETLPPHLQHTGSENAPGILENNSADITQSMNISAQQEDKIAENITISHIAGKSTDEVREMFQITHQRMIPLILSFWEDQVKPSLLIHHVEALLEDKGVKLKRRKKMGPEIPASEKKAIRAQRNRERSQVLRKHQKKRMQALEQVCQQLLIENSAVRSLVNCALEEPEALNILETYFDTNGCSEALVSFLRYII